MSTAMCRLRPLTLLPASEPRVSLINRLGGSDGLEVDDRRTRIDVPTRDTTKTVADHLAGRRHTAPFPLHVEGVQRLKRREVNRKRAPLRPLSTR